MIEKKHSKLVAARFLKAMKQIIANGIEGVKNQTDFVEKVGEYKQSITKIASGTRYPTIDVLCNTCLLFKVSPGWLLLGQGEMFSTGPVTFDMSILTRLNDIEKAIGNQKKQVKKKAS